MRGTTNKPAVGVIVRKGNQILLVLRGDIDWKPHEFTIPGGHVEQNETFRQAACREVLEETGLLIKSEDLNYKATVHRNSSAAIWVDTYFEVTKWSGNPKNAEPARHEKVEWHDIENLPSNLVDYIGYGLSVINDSKHYGEFGWDE